MNKKQASKMKNDFFTMSKARAKAVKESKEKLKKRGATNKYGTYVESLEKEETK